MSINTYKLKNNIEVLHKRNKNTLRIAFCFNIRSNNPETTPGVEGLMTRLFMQGTQKRTAEQLAEELDAYAIEFTTDAKPDYIRLKFVCLNEDFYKAIEILEDVLKNSTFKDFDKELIKMEGELIAELDSPRAKAIDKYYSEIFDGHHYGHSTSKILENIKNITKEQVLDTYNALLNNSKKVITVVGDIDAEEVNTAVNKAFKDLPVSIDKIQSIPVRQLDTNKKVEIIKPDVNQAHIIKGWLTETLTSEDYPALILLNIILGASGLSSRLFLELRDKKGLAYVVRSCYESFANVADFYIYIATEPKNIDISLAGFEEEIRKITTTPVSEEELQNAKNNLFGKWAFARETNNNQACYYSNYGILGVGFDFNDKVRKFVQEVTSEQILACAKKCFSTPSVTSILKP